MLDHFKNILGDLEKTFLRNANIKLKFYCEKNDTQLESSLFLIKDGEIIFHKNFKYLEKQELINEVQNKLENNITNSTFIDIADNIEMTNPFLSRIKFYNLNLVQTKYKNVSLSNISQSNFILPNNNSRLTRFILAMIIVMITSLMCFVFIKSSVDWVSLILF